MEYNFEFVTGICAAFILFCLPALDTNYYRFLVGAVCLLLPAFRAVCRDFLVPTYIWVTESDSVLAYFIRDSKVLLLLLPLLFLFFLVPWLCDNLEDGPLPVAPDIPAGDAQAPSSCDDSPPPAPVTKPNITSTLPITKLPTPPPSPSTKLPTPPPTLVHTLPTPPPSPFRATPTPPPSLRPEGSFASPAINTSAPYTPAFAGGSYSDSSTENAIDSGHGATRPAARQSSHEEQFDSPRSMRYTGAVSINLSERITPTDTRRRVANRKANVPIKYAARRLRATKTDSTVPMADSAISTDDEPKSAESSPPTVELSPEDCDIDDIAQSSVIGTSHDSDLGISSTLVDEAEKGPVADAADQSILRTDDRHDITKPVKDPIIGISDIWETPDFPAMNVVDDMDSGADEQSAAGVADHPILDQKNGDADTKPVEASIVGNSPARDAPTGPTTDVFGDVDFGIDEQTLAAVVNLPFLPEEEGNVAITPVVDAMGDLLTLPDDIEWETSKGMADTTLLCDGASNAAIDSFDDVMDELPCLWDESQIEPSIGVNDDPLLQDSAKDATIDPVDNVMGELPDVWTGFEQEVLTGMETGPLLPDDAGDSAFKPIDLDMSDIPDVYDFLAQEARYWAMMDLKKYNVQPQVPSYGHPGSPATPAYTPYSNPYGLCAPGLPTAQPDSASNSYESDMQPPSTYNLSSSGTPTYPDYDPYKFNPQPYPILITHGSNAQAYPAPDRCGSGNHPYAVLDSSEPEKQPHGAHDPFEWSKQPSNTSDLYKDLYKSKSPAYTPYNPSDFGKQPHGPYNPFESTKLTSDVFNPFDDGKQPESPDEQSIDSGYYSETWDSVVDPAPPAPSMMPDSAIDPALLAPSPTPDSSIDPSLLALSPTSEPSEPAFSPPDAPKSKGKRRASDDETSSEVEKNDDNDVVQSEEAISPNGPKRRSIKGLKKGTKGEDRSEVAQFAAGAPKYDIKKLAPSMLQAYKGVKRRDSDDDAEDAGAEQPAKRVQRDMSDSSNVVLDPTFPTETYRHLEGMGVADAAELISKWLVVIKEEAATIRRNLLKIEHFLTIHQRLTQATKYVDDHKQQNDGKVTSVIRDACDKHKYIHPISLLLIPLQSRTDLSAMATTPCVALSALNKAVHR